MSEIPPNEWKSGAQILRMEEAVEKEEEK